MSAAPSHLPSHVEDLSPATAGPFEGAHWYDLADPTHFWMRWRLSEARRILQTAQVPTNSALLVLDVGGGVGVARAQLETVTAWRVDLAELDTGALTRSRAGRGRTLHYDILEQSPSLQGHYDVVVLFDVLEHIHDTEPFLRALAGHLKPGGHLLINVPALPRGHSRYDDAVGHIRRYSKASLCAELPPGMDVVDVRYWGMGLIPLLFARKAWLDTAGRRLTRDETLQAGFRSPGPIGSGLLDHLMRREQRQRRGVPIGTSLMLCATTSCGPSAPAMSRNG